MITTAEELKGTKIRIESIEQGQSLFGFASALGFRFIGDKEENHNLHLQTLLAFDKDMKMYYFDRDQESSFVAYPNRLITYADIFGREPVKKSTKPSAKLSVEDLENLHAGFKFWIKKQNYRFVNQMMLMFNEDSSEDEIKNVLMITKPIQDHELLRKNRQRIKFILDAIEKKK